MHELTVDTKLNPSFNSFCILLHSITVNIALNLNKKSNPNESMKTRKCLLTHLK